MMMRSTALIALFFALFALFSTMAYAALVKDNVTRWSEGMPRWLRRPPRRVQIQVQQLPVIPRCQPP
ncbi:hypothetical protein BGY98DRAFT_1187341 [Russula aff. rugulosa BPL654]|nr:hypothetical protein BGY98DRAFT_1187341 [Russula aff. rugulosa BPL654]